MLHRLRRLRRLRRLQQSLKFSGKLEVIVAANAVAVPWYQVQRHGCYSIQLCVPLGPEI